MGRTMSPKQTANLLDPKITQPLSADEIHPSSYGSPKSKNPFNEKFSKTETEAMAHIVKQRQLDKQGLQQPP